MILWFALIIPMVACGVAYYYFGKAFVWWELLLPTVASAIFILISKTTIESALLTDTQYKGGLIIEARYYEYWSTWVQKTCSERYACGSHTEGTGKNAHSVTDYCTRYYDCSYCDEHAAYWMIYDNQGHSWPVTEDEYQRLKQEWKSTPALVNLGRSISYHFDCGRDGNMYKVDWDGNKITSETSTWSADYTNHVQVSKQNFGINDVSEKDAKRLGLYDYPDITGYTQYNILGMGKMKFLGAQQRYEANKLFQYFNGNYGSKRKIRLFILLTSGKNMTFAIKQRDYWVGGNKNEMVLCIDADSLTGKINWVYPFSWSENKRVGIDLREDISNLGVLDFEKMYDVIDTDTKGFIFRDFSQFDYLSVDPPLWEVWLVYIITTGITVGLLYWGYKNEFESE